MRVAGAFWGWAIPDRVEINRQFRKRLHRKPEWENPILYNDKLQWLKLYWRDEQARLCVDKYRVRDFVERTVGRNYLNTLIGVFDSVQDINFEKLPQKFVLKTTHASGTNVFCFDKSQFDWNHAQARLALWLTANSYWFKREWVYRDITPRIVCEAFIEPVATELRDFRFFCFDGKARFIAVDTAITDKRFTRRNLFDLSWKPIDAEITYPRNIIQSIPPPRHLAEMIEVSEALSRGFPHVRVDLYCEKRVMFGEMTFFHQSGMGVIRPEAFERRMGDWLRLPTTTVS